MKPFNLLLFSPILFYFLIIIPGFNCHLFPSQGQSRAIDILCDQPYRLLQSSYSRISISGNETNRISENSISRSNSLHRRGFGLSTLVRLQDIKTKFRKKQVVETLSNAEKQESKKRVLPDNFNRRSSRSSTFSRNLQDRASDKQQSGIRLHSFRVSDYRIPEERNEHVVPQHNPGPKKKVTLIRQGSRASENSEIAAHRAARHEYIRISSSRDRDSQPVESQMKDFSESFKELYKSVTGHQLSIDTIKHTSYIPRPLINRFSEKLNRHEDLANENNVRLFWLKDRSIFAAKAKSSMRDNIGNLVLSLPKNYKHKVAWGRGEPFDTYYQKELFKEIKLRTKGNPKQLRTFFLEGFEDIGLHTLIESYKVKEGKDSPIKSVSLKEKDSSIKGKDSSTKQADSLGKPKVVPFLDIPRHGSDFEKKLFEYCMKIPEIGWIDSMINSHLKFFHHQIEKIRLGTTYPYSVALTIMGREE